MSGEGNFTEYSMLNVSYITNFTEIRAQKTTRTSYATLLVLVYLKMRSHFHRSCSIEWDNQQAHGFCSSPFYCYYTIKA